MHNKILFEKLISPDNQKRLYFDALKQTLSTEDGLMYQIINSVPILRPKFPISVPSESMFHKNLNTSFLYSDHYQKDAEVSDYFEQTKGATAHENKRLHETIISQIPKTTKSILDVGCGSAWVAEHFCQKGVNVISMDISTINPIKALKKYPFENHAAITADVFHLPFKKASFDCIIASEIIEHVANPTIFIKNLFEVLSPDGILIITTPYKEEIPFSVCIHCNNPTPHNAHIHSFDKQKFQSILHSINIKNYKMKIFSNSLLLKLRTYIILRFFPYFLWKLVDNFFISIFNNPKRLLVKMVNN
jgi:2-polyprenyl-3-methyl-5-hydroxy-6-metoxy-1,4-benzoquinol methylase